MGPKAKSRNCKTYRGMEIRPCQARLNALKRSTGCRKAALVFGEVEPLPLHSVPTALANLPRGLETCPYIDSRTNCCKAYRIVPKTEQSEITIKV